MSLRLLHTSRYTVYSIVSNDKSFDCYRNWQDLSLYEVCIYRQSEVCDTLNRDINSYSANNSIKTALIQEIFEEKLSLYGCCILTGKCQEHDRHIVHDKESHTSSNKCCRINRPAFPTNYLDILRKVLKPTISLLKQRYDYIDDEFIGLSTFANEEGNANHCNIERQELGIIRLPRIGRLECYFTAIRMKML